MAVTILRRTGIIGMAGTIAIKINGDKVDKVGSEKQVEINLPSGKAQLKVSQFGTRSNVLEINDGETIEITTPKLSNLIFLLIILFPLLTNFIPNFQYRMVSMVIYTIFALIILFGKNWYQIKKI
ncbi:MAG: hypothetical protein WBA84_05200 [Carnobacterium sp.]|uniref:hypothetical protein n=1 Tax=Carnobacterium sp. TaxID=48221 RepID=UPI003C795B7F